MNTPKRRVLVIGSGGREHAMIVALAQCEDVTLFCAPGNPGTASLATNLDASATDVAALAAMAKAHAIDLVIPGPEATLSLGIADELARVAPAWVQVKRQPGWNRPRSLCASLPHRCGFLLHSVWWFARFPSCQPRSVVLPVRPWSKPMVWLPERESFFPMILMNVDRLQRRCWKESWGRPADRF